MLQYNDMLEDIHGIYGGNHDKDKKNLYFKQLDVLFIRKTSYSNTHGGITQTSVAI